MTTGYFSQDNIDYHVSWLKCARDAHPDIGSIDYMGIWNERTWGNPTWIKQLRTALDDGGFSSVKLVLPDQNNVKSIEDALDTDADFGKALEGGAIGLHYPCNRQHPEVQGRYGLKFWSSEDYSTVADWAGAGCWGRILNQNFVRMNMTSTISWSLVWSVYDDWPYFGNGLMYAYWPWTGHYTVNEAIWTSAHHCQFIEPGWSYIGGSGRGTLAQGGSYVALVDPTGQEVSIVLEKLHGKCLRCAGQTTSGELVQLRLAGALTKHAALSVWSTNETHQFVRLADSVVDADTGFVSVFVGPDSIVTLSSTSGQQKGTVASIAADTAFPLPYSDDFEARKPPQMAKYFADNGGSFEIMLEPLRKGNQVLGQVVAPPPVKNAWGRNVEPITVLGDKTWGNSGNERVSVDILLPTTQPGTVAAPDAYAGVCLRVQGGGGRQNKRGHCLSVYGSGTWTLSEDGAVLAQGELEAPVLETWQSIAIEGDEVQLRGFVAGELVGAAAVGPRQGRVALTSSWNLAYFDNFAVGLQPPSPPAPTPPPPPPATWTDLGAGCCGNLMEQRAKALFDGKISGGLAGCQARCSTQSTCGYTIFGWHGSDWCVTWPKSQGCDTLDAGGSGHCGSRGDNGVHSYRLEDSGSSLV